MQKTITIRGELNQKGSIAHKLAVQAAKDGKNLKFYIETLLERHVK